MCVCVCCVCLCYCVWLWVCVCVCAVRMCVLQVGVGVYHGFLLPRSRCLSLHIGCGRREGTGGRRGEIVLPGMCVCRMHRIGWNIVFDELPTPQVAIEKKQSLFIDDPAKIPGLEKNEDWVKFGYGYYVGAPWVVGQTKGSTSSVLDLLEGVQELFSSHFSMKSPWNLTFLCCVTSWEGLSNFHS